MKVAGFDWDEGNAAKCEKHGVTRTEIEELFFGVVTVLGDERHSTPNEQRHLAIGQSLDGRHILVALTLRKRHGAVLVRPISARYMHKREVAYYEKENPGA